MIDPTQRFSDRVADYVRYRPRYPDAVLQTLVDQCGLAPSDHVADIGSGTGFLAELFLRNGNPVFAVEPNRAMRDAGEELLRWYPQFHSVDGTAEATTLAARSVRLVTAGQAFHWFRPDEARREFARILQPGGWVALVWNERLVDTTPFLQAYEQLLRTYGVDYLRVSQRQMDPSVLGHFFGPGGYRRETFPNHQRLDFQGLQGRLLSSSYTPTAGHPQYAAMQAALEDIFRRHQHRGEVVLEYSTRMFYARWE